LHRGSDSVVKEEPDASGYSKCASRKKVYQSKKIKLSCTEAGDSKAHLTLTCPPNSINNVNYY